MSRSLCFKFSTSVCTTLVRLGLYACEFLRSYDVWLLLLLQGTELYAGAVLYLLRKYDFRTCHEYFWDASAATP